MTSRSAGWANWRVRDVIESAMKGAWSLAGTMTESSGAGTVLRGRSGVDPAQPGERGQLAGEDPLDPVAQGLLEDADVADQGLEALGLQRGGLVRAPHRPVQGDVPLDRDRAQGDRGQRDLQPALVPGVAHRHPVALLQRSDGAQVRL